MKPIFIYSDTILNMLSWFMRVGGISIFPIVILRERHKDPIHVEAFEQSQRIHRHETIHFRQQIEMLVVFFYLWYVSEFIINLCKYRHVKTAYKNISLELEAKEHEDDREYLEKRKLYNWLNKI